MGANARARAPRVEIVHELPGRVRLRVDGLRGSPELARWLARRLESRAEIRALEVSERTGRLLLRPAAGASALEAAAAVEQAVKAYLDTRALLDSVGGGAAGEPHEPRAAGPGEALPAGIEALASSTPGRVRLQIPALKRAPALALHLEEKLVGMRGILEARASTATGRLLLRFDPGVELRELVGAVHAALSDHQDPARAREIGALRPDASRADVAWHAIELGALARGLESTAELGLAARLARRRLGSVGPNALPAPRPRSRLALLAGQFTSLPVALLGGAALLSVATGGLTDALVILGVVALNGGIGFATERSTERAILALDSGSRAAASVVRDGQELRVPAEELVPGDVLVLRHGSAVPADARLVRARRLSVCEAPLTGESMPVEKSADCVVEAATPLAERLNMVYAGTVVTGGSGLAMVTATGPRTEVGRIQRLLETAEPPATPMERQLERIGGQVVATSSLVCAGVLGIGLLRGFGLVEMLTTSISLAVAAVPEGLPAVATTTLAFGVGAMRKRGVLIRHLPAVEALGSIEVLCLDKTGTLTENRMSVEEVFAGGQRLETGKRGGRLAARVVGAAPPPELAELLRAVSLCNEAELAAPEAEAPSGIPFEGSATETALLELAVGYGVDVAGLRQSHPRLRISHRTESRSYMKSLHGAPDGGVLLAVKGNPDEVLELCRFVRSGDAALPLSDAERKAIRAANERMAGDALRVLGVAEAAGPRESVEEQLTWLGLVGMADPLRDGMPALMRSFRRAGIRTTIITGDQRATALAVARELDLANGDALEIADASQLGEHGSDGLHGRLDAVHVICRASPGDKLRIVEALQSRGLNVAMTGDGVNDGPALRAAATGIAMGDGGADLARSVADVVLQDNQLEELVAAIRQGRAVRDNTRKALHYLLSTNLSEILVMLAALGVGLPAPLNPRQLLWLNLVSDVFPGLALALDEPDPDVLERPPLPADAPILARGDYRRIAVEGTSLAGAGLAAYAFGLARYGPGPRAGSLGFFSLACAQLLHALTCRSRQRSLLHQDGRPRNRALGITVAATLALQGLALVLPPLRRLLGMAPLGLLDVAAGAAIALLPLAVTELSKPPASTTR